MATYSAVMSGDSRYTLYLDVTESNVSIPNNTSVVNYTLRLVFSQSLVYGAWSNIGKYSLTINGVALASNVTFSYDFRNYSSLTLASGSLTVAHNADGSKTVGCSGYALMDDGKGSASPSGNFVLTTIARASQPTLSVSSQALGSQITIYTNKAAAFTHTLVYAFGNESNTIATGVVDNYAWTLPSSLASQIPSATSGTGTITCTTYNGSTNIGSKTVNFTATVPNNATYQPSIPSISLVPANQYNLAYIKTKSSLTVNSSSTGYYGASISSYTVTVNEKTLYGASVASGLLMTAGTNTVGVTVTDSRGFSRYNSTTFAVSDYFTPRIDAFTAVRSSPNTTVNIGVTYTISSGIPSSSTVQWSAAGANTWSASIKSWTDVNVNQSFATSSYSADSSFDFKLTVNDHFTSVSKTVTISTGFSLMNFNKSGKGIGIGQVSTAEKLEVNMLSDFKQGINLTAGSDLYLRATPGSTDTGDIVFSNDVGTELARLWNSEGVLWFRTAYGASKQVWHEGNLPLTSIALAKGRLNQDVNTMRDSGMYGVEGQPANAISAYTPVIAAKNIDVGLQISGGYNTDALWFRGWHTSGATFTPWRKVWHNGNFNPALYLPTDGGGLTGDLNMNQKIVWNMAYPAHADQAANKGYVDTKIASGYGVNADITNQNVHVCRNTGFYMGYNMGNAINGSWNYYIYQKHSEGYCTVISVPLDYSGFVYWKRYHSGTTWTNWNQIHL